MNGLGLPLRDRKGVFWRVWRWWISRPSSPFTAFLAEEVREAIARGEV